MRRFREAKQAASKVPLCFKNMVFMVVTPCPKYGALQFRKIYCSFTTVRTSNPTYFSDGFLAWLTL
jgi:hypothetical protein